MSLPYVQQNNRTRNECLFQTYLVSSFVTTLNDVRCHRSRHRMSFECCPEGLLANDIDIKRVVHSIETFCWHCLPESNSSDNTIHCFKSIVCYRIIMFLCFTFISKRIHIWVQDLPFYVFLCYSKVIFNDHYITETSIHLKYKNCFK